MGRRFARVSARSELFRNRGSLSRRGLKSQRSLFLELFPTSTVSQVRVVGAKFTRTCSFRERGRSEIRIRSSSSNPRTPISAFSAEACFFDESKVERNATMRFHEGRLVRNVRSCFGAVRRVIFVRGRSTMGSTLAFRATMKMERVIHTRYDRLVNRE